MKNELQIPEGWGVGDYAEPGADTGKTKKNLELVRPGPQSGEDDYHSKYVDPEGEFGAAKTLPQSRKYRSASKSGHGQGRVNLLMIE